MVFKFADGRGRECLREREGAGEWRGTVKKKPKKKTHGYMVVKEMLYVAYQCCTTPSLQCEYQ